MEISIDNIISIVDSPPPQVGGLSFLLILLPLLHLLLLLFLIPFPQVSLPSNLDTSGIFLRFDAGPRLQVDTKLFMASKLQVACSYF